MRLPPFLRKGITMIGTLTEAHTAVKEADAFDRAQGRLLKPKPVMEFIGAGAHRRAFLNPDKTVVYKVQRYARDDNNEREHANYIRLSVRDDIPDNLVIPEVTLYEVDGQPVNALPYVQGGTGVWNLNDKDRQKSYPIYEWLRKQGLYDTGHDNMLVCKGLFYLVDMEA